jgi:YD repeat-containing protein
LAGFRSLNREDFSKPKRYHNLHPSPGPQGYGFGLDLPIKLGYVIPQVQGNQLMCSVLLEEREGAYVKYKGKIDLKVNSVHAAADPTHLNKHGYTNYTTAGIAGVDHIKARKLDFEGFTYECKLHVDSDGNKRNNRRLTKGQCQVRLGSGGLRTYAWKAIPKHAHWYLTEELRPNGHKVLFEYDEKGSLKRMRTTNAAETLTFNRIEVDQKPDGITVCGSDEQSCHYSVITKQCHYRDKETPTHRFTNTITPLHGESVHLDYHFDQPKGWKNRWRKLNRITRADGRFLGAIYDETGRVTALEAPIGPNQESAILAGFVYGAGFTDVKDAQTNLTRYHHSPDKRIKAIEKFKTNVTQHRSRYNQIHEKVDYQPYCSTHYFWDSSEANAGNLLAKGIATPTKQFLHCSVGTYDASGNITQDDLYGNLSGFGRELFTIGSDHRPQESVECFTRNVTYSTDGFNVPLREEDSDGTLITYTYLEGTNLLTSKIVGDSKSIYEREFRTYSPDNLLTEIITDDGGVACRKFTAITPCLEGYAIGFPKTIIEGYVDLQTGDRLQLRRTEHEYNSQCLLVHQDIYDSDDQFAYALDFGYDQRRNLISNTDALGQKTVVAYDANLNKIREEQEGSGFHTVFSYDLANRLIAAEEIHTDGSRFVTRYGYDLVGNKISETDPYGNITHFKYDAFGREVEAIYPIADCVLRKEYNLLDQLTAVIDPKSNQTTTTYNIRGQPVCITHPDGTQERFQYNLNGTLSKKWEKEGLCHHYTYDGFHRVISTDTFDIDGQHQYTNHKDYVGSHLVRDVDALGYVTHYSLRRSWQKDFRSQRRLENNF